MVNTQASTTASQASALGELCVGADSSPIKITQDDQSKLTITLRSLGLDPAAYSEELEKTLQSQSVQFENFASVVFDVTRMSDIEEIPIQFFAKSSKRTPVQVLVTASQHDGYERRRILKLQKPNRFQITSVNDEGTP